MSKMKHLLRKLHIGGGGINDHHRLASSESTRPSPNLSPTPSQSPSASESSSSAHGGGMGRIGAVESSSSSVGDRTVTDGGGVVAAEVDFNLLEEEFQVQLALAISASDPDSREDPETAQIDAAKRISLGGSASISDNQALVKFLSPRYWVRYLSISNLYRSFLQIVCEFERIRFFSSNFVFVWIYLCLRLNHHFPNCTKLCVCYIVGIFVKIAF